MNGSAVVDANALLGVSHRELEQILDVGAAVALDHPAHSCSTSHSTLRTTRRHHQDLPRDLPLDLPFHLPLKR